MKNLMKLLRLPILLCFLVLCQGQILAADSYTLKSGAAAISTPFTWDVSDDGNNDSAVKNDFLPNCDNKLYAASQLNNNTLGADPVRKLTPGRAIGFKIAENASLDLILTFKTKTDRKIFLYEGETFWSDYTSSTTGVVAYIEGLGDQQASQTVTLRVNLNGGSTYWIGAEGGDAFIFTIGFANQLVVTAPNLEGNQIPEDGQAQYIWHSTGSNLTAYTDNYYSVSRVYYTGGGTLTASTEDVKVNGTNVKGYTISEGNSLGFRLRTVSGQPRNRIIIFSKSNSTGLLYEGDDVATATAVSGGYTTQINAVDAGGSVVGTGTYLLTYDLDNVTEDKTYWIKAPSGGLVLGGFEVFRDNTNGSTPGVSVLPWKTTAWNTSTTYTSGTNTKNVYQNVASANGGTIQALISGDCTNGVCVSGFAMPVVAFPENNVMMNKGNALTFKVAPGIKVTVDYIANSGTGVIKILRGGQKSSATEEASGNGGQSSISYTNTTGSEQSLWITGGVDDYVYISGFSMELANTSTQLNNITSDFLWYYNGGDGIFSTGRAYDGYTFRYTDFIDRAETTINVNGAVIHGTNGNDYSYNKSGSYKLTADDAIGFKLKGDQAYRIRIFSNSDATNLLWPSELPTGTLTPQTGVQSTLASDTYLMTYDITPAADQVYWIKPSADICLGGFEVLLNNAITVPSSLTAFDGESWSVDANVVSSSASGSGINVNLNTGFAYSVLKGGNHGKVYFYSADMPVDSTLIGGKRTVMLTGNNAIGVRLPANTKISIPTACNVILKDSPTGTQKTTTTVGTNMTYSTGSAEETLWICAPANATAYFSEFSLELDGDITNVINRNYIWYADTDITLNANSFTDTNADELTKNVGSAITCNGNNNTIIANNNDSKTFTLGPNALGFKVGSCVSNGVTMYTGVINIHVSSDAIVTLKTGLKHNNSIDVSIPPTVTIDERGNRQDKMVSYRFDTSLSGPQTFWIECPSGYLAGFDVMFDNQRGIPTLSSASFTVGRISNFNNALTGSVYNGINTIAIASGAFYDPTRLRTGLTNGPIMFNNENAIAFKIGKNKSYRLEVQLSGAKDTGVRLLKGSDFATAVAVDGTDLVLSADHYPTSSSVTYQPLSAILDNGDTEETYWLTGIDGNMTHFRGYSLTQITTPISKYHLYRPTDDLSSESGLIDNNYIQYSGDGAVHTAADVNVLGESGGTLAFEDGADNLTFRVAPGKKGHIRVYYKADGASVTSSEELPLDNLGAGWNSSYDPNTKTISFTATENWDAGRGWWFGETNPKDLTGYTDLVLELAEPTKTSYRLLVDGPDDDNISSAVMPAGTTQFIVDLKEATWDKSKVAQIYLQIVTVDEDADNNKVVIKSATLHNQAVELREDAVDNTLLYGGTTTKVQDVYVYDYPFDLTDATDVQQYWLTGGDMNFAALEVVYDDDRHVKVVEWYVNNDAKMIVGSDNPKWQGYKADGTTRLDPYPDDCDEFATFYVSSGRQAKVSFIMPQAVKDVDNWEKAVQVLIDNGTISNPDDNPSLKESDYSALKDAYGKHTIVISGSNKTGHDTFTFNRDKQKVNKNNIKDDLYRWYGAEVILPNVANFTDEWATSNHTERVIITATQKNPNGSTSYDGKGVWKICLQFVFFKSPVVSGTDLSTNDGQEITIAAGGVSSSTNPIYYTIDSTDPENGEMLTTKQYGNAAFQVKENCMVKAAQYITTPYEFFVNRDNGPDSETNTSFMVASPQHYVFFKQNNALAVIDNNTSNGDFLDTKKGATVVTIPLNTKFTGTADKNNNDQGYVYSSNPYLYLTMGSARTRYYRNIDINPSKWVFNHGGVNWEADQDGGLTTYLDSYRYKFKCVAIEAGDDIIEGASTDANSGTNNPKTNENSYTECNGGIGGATTEDGGLFLQPISGSFFRIEPEYDGVVSLWIRQNGAVDHNTQETGTITRRPVYIVDENGRVMRGSTVMPTNEHHLGINGVYADCSGVSEFRSTFEHTWQYGVAKSIYPEFGDNFPNRWEEEGDTKGTFKYFYDYSYGVNDYRAAYIMYGAWFSGISIDATRSTIESAKHVNRYGYTGNQPMYRSDFMFNLENSLGFTNRFAKYGYEMPNFAYVRYRFPVKAGKSYYLGGRGTRTDFVAIQFDPLEANTNGQTGSKQNVDKYRYKDNYDIKGYKSTDTGIVIDIDQEAHQDRTNTNVYSITDDIFNSYNTTNLTPITISSSNANKGILNGISINKMDDGNEHVPGYVQDNVTGTTVNVTLTRTFREGYWHPIVLPFSVSETRVEELFGEGTVVLYLDPAEHTFDNELGSDGNVYRSAMRPALEESRLTFTYHRYQMLYANVPAFICPTFTWTKTYKNGAYTHKPTYKTDNSDNNRKYVESITFNRVTIDKSNLGTSGYDHIGYEIGGGYEVVGTYDYTTVKNQDVYYINNNNGSASLMYAPKSKNTKGINMVATSVWIQPVKGKDNAPIRTLGYSDFSQEEIDLGTDMTSAIEDIVADEYPIEMYSDNNVYDMLGRIVGYGTTEGLPEGVYIFQGKKVYIR